MRTIDALQYLPQRYLSPVLIVQCASHTCNAEFRLGDAVAFPARFGDEVHMAFYCSELCYLDSIPP
jgi:hypothetical protein